MTGIALTNSFFDTLFCDREVSNIITLSGQRLASSQLNYKNYESSLGVLTYTSKVRSGIPIIAFYPLFQLSHEDRERFCEDLVRHIDKVREPHLKDFTVYLNQVCPKLTWQIKPDKAVCQAAFPQSDLWQELFHLIAFVKTGTPKSRILQKAFHDISAQPLVPYSEEYDFQTLFCEVVMNLLHVYLRQRHNTPRRWQQMIAYKKKGSLQINRAAHITEAPYVEVSLRSAFLSGLANVLEALKEDLLAHTSVLRVGRRRQTETLTEKLHHALIFPDRIASGGALSLSNSQAQAQEGDISLSLDTNKGGLTSI